MKTTFSIIRKTAAINLTSILLALTFLLFGTNSIVAQAPSMRQYTVADGLPTSNVYATMEDKNGMIWFGTDKGLVRFDGYRFRVFDPIDINGSSEIWELKEDLQGRIWCSTFKNALYFENEKFHKVVLPIDDSSTQINQYFFSSQKTGFCWSSQPHRLFEIQMTDSIQFSHIPLPKEWKNNSIFGIYFLKNEPNGNRWFAINLVDRIVVMKQNNGQSALFKVEKPQREFARSYYRPFVLNDGNILLFSEKMAFLFDFETFQPISFSTLFGEEFTLLKNYQVGNFCLLSTDAGYKFLDKNQRSLPHLSFLNHIEINTIFEDSQQNIWIGTPYSGIYFLSHQAQNSLTIPVFGKRDKERIIAIAQDNQQRNWLGLTNGNILKQTGEFSFSEIKIHFSAKGQQPTQRVKELLWDNQENLHIIYDSGTLLIIPKQDLNREEIFLDFVMRDSFPKMAQYFDENQKSNLWGSNLGSAKSYKFTANNSSLMASSNGVYAIDLSRKLLGVQKISDKRAYAATYWKNQLWMGRKEGLFFQNEEGDEFKDPNFTNAVLGLESSKNAKLWVAVEGKGVFRYDGLKVDSITKLLDNQEVIKKVLPHENGDLWVITSRGITKIEVTNDVPFQYNLLKYTTTDGLSSNEIQHIVVEDASIFAVTSEELTILNQQQEPIVERDFPLIFTDFKINHQSTLPKSVIDLSHRENNISIEFAGLYYTNPSEVKYEYRMEGIDKDWQQTTESQINYSGLPPDNYVFHLRAKNQSDLIGKEIKMSINILPPWWLTKWAYSFYTLAILGLILIFTGLYVKQKLATQKVLQAQELDDLKNRFFTNISHEFRTPLTIILGMADQLSTAGKGERQKAAMLIQRHGSKLLNLVSQVLDLVKLQEGGNLETLAIRRDVVREVQDSVDSFEEFAKSKSIELSFSTEVEKIVMDFYPQELQTCLTNLLSNALKFTPAGGGVSVKLSVLKNTIFENNSGKKPQKAYLPKTLLLTVQDSGKGMNDKEMEQIFDRFYSGNTHLQSVLDSGTGVGLALTKELVEKMNGKIEVKSQPQEGTVFKIFLPITQIAPMAEHIENESLQRNNIDFKQIENNNNNTATNQNLPQLLIIEDEPDMFIYLQDLLKNKYQITHAQNGKEGIELAIEQLPDLILSDVLMPEMNGYELCQTLKNDKLTSHIPIILLTAKSQQGDKLEGLSHGADAYLTKPFDKRELFIRLEKLRELRQILHQRYANVSTEKLVENPVPTLQLEDEFITNLREFILQNINAPDLNVERICKEVAMSRTQLHRKMTALTGISIGKFIKEIRITKAKELLETTDLPISEIAFQTGYSAKQFSMVFKKAFGETPGNFRKNL